jgi:hypothetical protein
MNNTNLQANSYNTTKRRTALFCSISIFTVYECNYPLVWVTKYWHSVTKKGRNIKEESKRGKSDTCTHKVPACTIAEIMKNSVAMILQHFSMDVEARVTKLSNLLCQQFNTVYRVTEYY